MCFDSICAGEIQATLWELMQEEALALCGN